MSLGYKLDQLANKSDYSLEVTDLQLKFDQIMTKVLDDLKGKRIRTLFVRFPGSNDQKKCPICIKIFKGAHTCSVNNIFGTKMIYEFK